MSLCKGFTQGGSNADILLTDSYLKNITDEVDWATGYEAVVSNAEGESRSDSVTNLLTAFYRRASGLGCRRQGWVDQLEESWLHSYR
jgi:hypothetical protein